MKFPPVSAPLAALDTKGTIGPIETTDGLEHAADLGVRMELPETMDGDQYIRDAMTTRERMKNRWASLIETVVHGVERVD